jgi:hypothetical protein
LCCFRSNERSKRVWKCAIRTSPWVVVVSPRLMQTMSPWPRHKLGATCCNPFTGTAAPRRLLKGAPTSKHSGTNNVKEPGVYPDNRRRTWTSYIPKVRPTNVTCCHAPARRGDGVPQSELGVPRENRRIHTSRYSGGPMAECKHCASIQRACVWMVHRLGGCERW